MKLWFDKRSKDPIYYAQMGYRNGKKVTTKNIKRIGKHSELLKICDDPLAYAKEEIRKLNEEYRSGKANVEFVIDFNERLRNNNEKTSHMITSNIGYLYLLSIYQKLELDSFFNKIKGDHKITYDPDMINRFLVMSRILDPRSKLGTFDHLDTYYEKPSFSYQNIHRFMKFVYPYYNEYITHLYKASNNIYKRDNRIIYYDCTNFSFESETYDEDYIDEVTNETSKGLRQYGPAKDHKPAPLVEMGLIMDKNSIPMTMCIEHGNKNEQLTAIPLEEELIKMTGNSKFIYVADGGLGSFNIRNFNAMGGRAFIVTQSIKKLSNTLKEAVFNDCDYHLLSNDLAISLEYMMSFDHQNSAYLDLYNDRAYKVVIADKMIDLGLEELAILKNGKTIKKKSKGLLRQRLIITYSRKVKEYQRYIRDRQIERAKRLLAINDPEQIKKGPNDIRRFLKRESKGEVKYYLDMEKIKEEEKYDGFYCIATNLEDDVRDILEVMSKRYHIEENFRILKTYFNTAPIYHFTPIKIKVHFLICFTALLIYRLIEVKLDENKTHITTSDLLETLRNMNIVNIHDHHYQALYNDSYTLKALEEVFHLNLNRKYYLPKDLNRLCKNLNKKYSHTTI